MKLQGRYRHELKFQISQVEYEAIRRRLQPVMQRDIHAGVDGHYAIHSIYFDNFNDKALREKVNGVQQREKFRIRYYNNNFSYITLEKKIKHNNLCMKVDASITEAECRAIAAGDTDWMMTHPSGLVRELYCKMKFQQLRPRALVSYVREPYVYAPGNVRVTFDSQIRSSLFHWEFMQDNLHDISATDTPADMILEIKYDAFLPEIIEKLLNLKNVRQQAFSKYGACRRYG